MPQCVCPHGGEGVTGRLFDARDNHGGTVCAPMAPGRRRDQAAGLTFGNKPLPARLLREWEPDLRSHSSAFTLMPLRMRRRPGQTGRLSCVFHLLPLRVQLPGPRSCRFPSIRQPLYWVLALLLGACWALGSVPADGRAGLAGWCGIGQGCELLAESAVSPGAQPHCAQACVSPHVMVARQTAWTVDAGPAGPEGPHPVALDLEHEQPDCALPPAMPDCSVVLPAARPLCAPAGIYAAPQRGLARPPDLG